MSITVTELRKNIKAGKASIGTWLQLPSPDVAEILSKSGYDWLAVDMEHGAFSRQSLSEIFRAIELGTALPFARVAEASLIQIKSALEAGAKGLIFPMIESAEQLQNAIDYALYPPQGKRGVGYCRANLFGKNFINYLEQANDLLLIAQIEHIRATENLETILANPRLDAIMVGPYDLSASMGITGLFEHEEFIKVMQKITEKTKEFDVAMGAHIVLPDSVELKRKIEQGYKFIAYGIDAVFLYSACRRPQI